MMVVNQKQWCCTAQNHTKSAPKGITHDGNNALDIHTYPMNSGALLRRLKLLGPRWVGLVGLLGSVTCGLALGSTLPLEHQAQIEPLNLAQNTRQNATHRTVPNVPHVADPAPQTCASRVHL